MITQSPLHIEIIGMEKFRAIIRAWGDAVPSEIYSAAYKVAQDMQNDWKNRIASVSHAGRIGVVDTGRYLNSVKVEPIPGSTKVNFGFQVRSNSGYSAAVEFGSKPHWPPIDKLIPWVRRKLLGRKRYSQNATKKNRQINEEKGIAFCVARAISKRGTPPAATFTPAVEKMKEAWKARLDAIFTKWHK